VVGSLAFSGVPQSSDRATGQLADVRVCQPARCWYCTRWRGRKHLHVWPSASFCVPTAGCDNRSLCTSRLLVRYSMVGLTHPLTHKNTHQSTHTRSHTRMHTHTHTHTHTRSLGGGAEERGYGRTCHHLCVAIFVCVCCYIYLCVGVSCILGICAYASMHDS